MARINSRRGQAAHLLQAATSYAVRCYHVQQSRQHYIDHLRVLGASPATLATLACLTSGVIHPPPAPLELDGSNHDDNSIFDDDSDFGDMDSSDWSSSSSSSTSSSSSSSSSSDSSSEDDYEPLHIPRRRCTLFTSTCVFGWVQSQVDKMYSQRYNVARRHLERPRGTPSTPVSTSGSTPSPPSSAASSVSGLSPSIDWFGGLSCIPSLPTTQMRAKHLSISSWRLCSTSLATVGMERRCRRSPGGWDWARARFRNVHVVSSRRSWAPGC
jgi:hypothetical protein